MLLRIVQSAPAAPVVVESQADGAVERQTVETALPELGGADVGSRLGQWLFEAGGALFERITQAEAGVLRVEICGAAPEFTSHEWEAMTLPGREEPLALQCASFQRIAASATATSQIVRVDPDRTAMRVLCVVAAGVGATPSDVYSLLVQTIASDRPVIFDLLVSPDAATLARVLQQQATTIDAVHIDGPCTWDGHAWQLGLADTAGKPESVCDLADLLRNVHRAGIPLATLDLGIDTPVAGGAALMLAQVSAAVPCITLAGRARCGASRPDDFATIYRELAAGACIGRAVIAARAASKRPSFAPIAYGDAEVRFFAPSERSEVDRVLAQPFSKVRSGMFGFRSSMLPPESVHASRAWLALAGDARTEATRHIDGEAGSGRTHLSHQLAFHDCMRDDGALAFYFDYAEAFYRRSDMCEMIAPVLQIDASDADALELALAERRCHFVIDAFPSLSSVPVEESDAYQDTVAFLRRLGDRHRLTWVASSAPDADCAPFLLPAMTGDELRLIAEETAAAIGLAQPDVDLSAICQHSSGNPWLLKKALARRLSQSDADVIAELQALPPGGDRSTYYFLRRFEQLPGHWQELLRLMLDFPGLYFQVLCITPPPTAADSPPAAVERLMRAMGNETAVPADAIPVLESAGLIVRSGLGHLIEPSARRFLVAHAQGAGIPPDEQTHLALSATLCESLCVIGPRLQSSENQMLAFHIVANRQHWARALETLWRAREFSLFFSARHQLQQLLAAQRIHDEVDAWSHDLICRTDSAYFEDDADTIPVLAWLTLARSSLTSAERASHPVILDATQHLSERFLAQSFEAELERDELALTAQCIHFLESSYHVRGDWNRCHQVSEHAYRFGKRLGQANRVMRSLKSMAKCCDRLGRFDECLVLEDEFIEMLFSTDLPIPEPTRVALALECLDDRVRRNVPGAAQQLLDRMGTLRVEPPLERLLNRYRADVLFMDERLEEAAEIYGTLKRQCTAAEFAGVGAEHVNSRIDTLKQRLDPAVFARLCIDPPVPESRTVH